MVIIVIFDTCNLSIIASPYITVFYIIILSDSNTK